jgi:hypothetical protein
VDDKLLGILMKNQRNMTLRETDFIKKINSMAVRAETHSSVKVDDRADVFYIKLNAVSFNVVIEIILLSQRVYIKDEVILCLLVVVLCHVTCIMDLLEHWIVNKEIFSRAVFRTCKVHVWSESTFDFGCTKL